MPAKDNIEEYIGKTINGLTILREDGRNQNQKRMVLCKCNYCGKEKSIIFSTVKTGRTKSCGCITGKLGGERTRTHGLSKHPLYRMFHEMKRRCYNENCKCYDDYGGRGIRICDEWLNSFEKFYHYSIKHGWEEGLEIDRIHNDGNYEPKNIRFVTHQENSINKSRPRRDNKTGYNHVSYSNGSKSYKVQIRMDGKFLFNKSGFKTAEEAAIARDQFIMDNRLPIDLVILKDREEKIEFMRNKKSRWK